MGLGVEHINAKIKDEVPLPTGKCDKDNCYDSTAKKGGEKGKEGTLPHPLSHKLDQPAITSQIKPTNQSHVQSKSHNPLQNKKWEISNFIVYIRMLNGHLPHI